MSTSPVGQNRWLAFLNSSGEAIPPFAVMQIDGTDDSDPSRPVIKVKKPEGFGAEHLYLINGLTQVEDGEQSLGTRDVPTYVLFEPESDDPALGEAWGPQADSWKIHRNGSGFQILGGVKDDKIFVVQQSLAIIEGFLDDDLSPRDDATLAVHINDGTELIETDVTVTVVDRSGLTADAGDYLIAVHINGEWRPIGINTAETSASDGGGQSSESDGSNSGSGSGSGSGDGGDGGDGSDGDGSGGDGGSGGSGSADTSNSGDGSGNSTSGSGFECSSGQLSLDVVTDVRCEDGDIVVCTRTLCLPAGTQISPEDCGDGDSDM